MARPMDDLYEYLSRTKSQWLGHSQEATVLLRIEGMLPRIDREYENMIEQKDDKIKELEQKIKTLEHESKYK